MATGTAAAPRPPQAPRSACRAAPCYAAGRSPSMPQLSILVSETQLEGAGDRLPREVEHLEAIGRKILVIRYPPRFADELGIAQGHNTAIYRGHSASAQTVVPNEVLIEFE